MHTFSKQQKTKHLITTKPLFSVTNIPSYLLESSTKVSSIKSNENSKNLELNNLSQKKLLCLPSPLPISFLSLNELERNHPVPIWLTLLSNKYKHKKIKKKIVEKIQTTKTIITTTPTPGYIGYSIIDKIEPEPNLNDLNKNNIRIKRKSINIIKYYNFNNKVKRSSKFHLNKTNYTKMPLLLNQKFQIVNSKSPNEKSWVMVVGNESAVDSTLSKRFSLINLKIM